jgi:hypothetical protein
VSAVLAITEAPAAYAASRCLAARIRDRGRWTTAQHPSRCGWCDIPTDVLDPMVRHFNELVEFDVRNRTSTSGAVTFGRLDRDEQLVQILAAQALEDEPPPAPGRPVDGPAPVTAGGTMPESRAATVEPAPAAREATIPTSTPAVTEPRQTPATRPSWAGGGR